MAKKFVKPTPKEVTEYALSIGYVLDGEAFCDFYESKGWLVGRSPMKSWPAAVRTWKRMERKRHNSTPWGYDGQENPPKKVGGKTIKERYLESCNES